jgi:hypothetical protein
MRNAAAKRRIKSNPLRINFTYKPKTSSVIREILVLNQDLQDYVGERGSLIWCAQQLVVFESGFSGFIGLTITSLV